MFRMLGELSIAVVEGTYQRHKTWGLKKLEAVDVVKVEISSELVGSGRRDGRLKTKGFWTIKQVSHMHDCRVLGRQKSRLALLEYEHDILQLQWKQASPLSGY